MLYQIPHLTFNIFATILFIFVLFMCLVGVLNIDTFQNDKNMYNN